MALNYRLPITDYRLPNKFGRIGVLMGGPSTERKISLKSGKAVYESLKQSNLEVIPIDIKTDNQEENIRLIKSSKINCAFVALHGRFGEDGQIQEIMDNLGIPYTGSGVEASRLAMDKIASRKIFQVHGLPVPKYKSFDRCSYNTNWHLYHNFNLPRPCAQGRGLPLVIKPATHGSSIGVSFINKKEALDKAVELAFSFDERIIIEEYIEGREMTVGILDEQALPVIEIIPKKRFFDYEAKYQVGMTDYIVPAKIEDALAKKIQEIGLAAHKLLGCFGCSRVDMILGKDNTTPYVLEVNTIPGLTTTSLLPKAAKVVGIEFSQLCLKLIKLACEKK